MPAPALFAFVQVEVPWILGPADGRYVVRGHAGTPEHVLVVSTLSAPVTRRRVRSRRARVEAPGAGPASTIASRATLIDAQPLAQPGERWLAAVDLQAHADRAISAINRVLGAQRLAAADPAVRPVDRTHSLAVRVGVGAGEQVAEGRWSQAVCVPPPPSPRGSRGAGLHPVERLAAVLAGRDVLLATEELTLRARVDADAERWRECALQLRAALQAARAELVPWSGQGDIDERLAELADLSGDVAAAAGAALEGGPGDEQIAGIGHALARLEAALRARTAVQLGR